MSSICVSVIVPAYNASATIGQSLEAITRQNCFQPFEVIVVDDGSSDNTADIVSSYPSVRYVRQNNAGPASARNLGAQLAMGEYLAFTDSDCIPREDWIAKLMEGFVQQQVGAVAGGYGIANPGSWLANCINKEIFWRHACLMPDFPNSFGSYNFCVKKSIFQAVGGFNTAYRRASGEDNDLSYKIVQSGWRIYFERRALVDHYHPSRLLKYLNEQFRHGYWRVKIYRDHPRMMRGDGYTYWKDIVEIPLAGALFLGLAVSPLHGVRLGDVVCFVFFPFLLLEIFSALSMMSSLFEGISFGFVLLFRAVSRMLGFSTGILSLLSRKKKKIF
jgi:glycosyltransferase involved in cell wall biosynthesis